MLAVWLAFNWCSTLIHLIRYYNPLPVSDYWRVIEDLPLMKAGGWSWLWRQHNEHRIVFPELVFALDQWLFAARQIVPLVVSLCCYVGAVVLLGLRFWCDSDAAPRIKTQALLLAGVIAGWPLSVYVLGTSFLLQWTLLQLAVVLAMVAVPKIAQPSGRRWVAICTACATVATYSSANGLLLWPILLLIAAGLHAPRNRLIALAAAAALSIGLFFVGYQRPGVPLLSALHHPVYWLGFVISYFSMPFGALRQPAFGIAFGLVGLLLWLTCLARNFRRPPQIQSFYVVALGYFAFMLFTAILTSVGRENLADPGFGNAKATRYLTFPLLGWAIVAAFTLAMSYREHWKRFSTRVVLLSMMAVVGFMQIRLGRWLRINDSYVAFQQWAAISVQNGLLDPVFLGSVFPRQAFIEHFLPMLREDHQSVFAEPAVDMIGKDFRTLFPQARTEVEPGGVLRTTFVRGGISLVGWAANLDWLGRDTVFFVDGSGKIAGFGRHLRAGIPQQMLALPAKTSQTWAGFINGQYRSTSFVPYLVELRSKSAFPLSNSVEIPVESGSVPRR